MAALSMSPPSFPFWQRLVQSNLPGLERATTPKLTKYIAEAPTPRQQAFLLLDCPEALFGGAAGGGKSSALLMAALQFVDVPGYASLLVAILFIGSLQLISVGVLGEYIGRIYMEAKNRPVYVIRKRY